MLRSDEAYASNFPSALHISAKKDQPSRNHVLACEGSLPDLHGRHRSITHVPPRNDFPFPHYSVRGHGVLARI